MKLYLFKIFSVMTFVSSGQSLSFSSGYFFDHYASKNKSSAYHPSTETYYWAFLGGSINYSRNTNIKFLEDITYFGRFYPIMYGFELSNNYQEDFFYVGEELIAPEVGFVSHYLPIDKKRYNLKVGLGLSARFVFLPITGSVLEYNSPLTEFESIHIQSSRVAVSSVFDIKHTFFLTQDLGAFINVNRTIGFYSWIENNIVYNDITTSDGSGQAKLINRGNRSIIEFGLELKFDRK